VKFDELKFEATDCCADHMKAQVSADDGTILTITVLDVVAGLYGVVVTDTKGLVSRQIGLSIPQVEALLPFPSPRR
jgi:hypothetical protein